MSLDLSKLVQGVEDYTPDTSAPATAAPSKHESVQDKVARIAAEEGVSADLALRVAKTESNFNANAHSNKNANGVMQVIPATFHEMMGKDSDPSDVDNNIRAGTRYLRKQLDDFGGDEKLALAAYNAGPNAVRKYNGIPPYKETQNYVDKITGDAPNSGLNLQVGGINKPSEPLASQEPLPNMDELTPRDQLEQLIKDKQAAKDAPYPYKPHQNTGLTDVAKDNAERDRKANESPWDATIHGHSTGWKQLPQMGAGFAAFVGDALGSDGLKKWGLDSYKAQSDDIGKDTQDYEDLGTAWNTNQMGKWAGYALGYSAAQIEQAIATGGFGSIIAKVGAKKLLTATVEKAAAEAVEQMAAKAAIQASEQAIKSGMAKDAAKIISDNTYRTTLVDSKVLAHGEQVGKAAASLAAQKFGAALGLGANSEMMEIGQIYPDAASDAEKNGTEVNKGKVLGAASIAAGLDFIPEMRVGNKLLSPAERLVEGAVAKQAPSLVGRLTREIPKQMAFEGATEGAQTPIESWGANKDPFSPEGWKDIVNSAAMGAIGGSIGGVMAAIPSEPKEVQKAQYIPNSPLSNAASAGTSTPPPTTPNIGFTDPKNIAMHQDITNFLSDRDSMASLRQAGKAMPEEAAYVWRNVINNPELPLATRSRALEQAHSMLMNLGQFSQVATYNNPSQVATANNGTVAPQPVPLESDNTIEGDYIDEGKTLPRTALPRTAIADNSSTAENGNVPETVSTLDSVSPVETADAAPVANMPAQEPDAFTQREPAAVVNTDATKKRHDTIRSMVAQGFQTVTKNDAGENVLQHPTTGHTFPLTSPADTIVARHAIRKAIAEKAHAAATSPNNETPLPTAAQIEAENYKKGHVNLHGIDIAIENPEGSIRSGTDRSGKAWQSKLASHYGYIKKTTGADGDAVDVFIGSNPASDKVFIVDQINPSTSQFDEHKVMMGFNSQREASQGYQANYDKDWKGHGAIKELTIPEFKQWLASDTTQPARYEAPDNIADLNTVPDAKVSTAPNKQAAREWIRPEIEGLIRHKKDASQIGKRDQMDKLVDASKRYMAGEDVKPARIKALGMAFDGEPNIKEIIDRIYAGIKSTPKVVAQPESSIAETATPVIDTPKIIDTPEIKEQKVSRDVQRHLFNELSNNAELLTQVANGEDAFLKAAEPLLAAQLEVMKAEGDTGNLTVDNMPSEFWSAVYRKAKSIAAAIAKEKNQDPAIYQEQLAKSAAESDINLDDSDVLNDFKAGFDHALKGKSKSTLSTGMVAVKQKGYEAAWSWIRTDDGKAWFEGKRKAKLQDTGADLKRWFDKAKEALNNLPDADPAKVYAAVKKLTERAKVFSVAYGENATIGTKAMADELRGKIRPFNDWVIAKGGLRRQYGMMSRTDEGAILNFLNAKSYVPKDTGNSDEWIPQERADYLISQATDWMTAVRDLADALSGAATVQELVDKFTTYAYIPEENTGFKLSVAGEELAYNFFMRTGRPSQFIKYGYYTSHYLATENLERVNNRSKALTPPRLDRVTRVGLEDYRQGKDVTPADVKAKFGFADIGFGKYVSTKQDQDHLNYTYDSFMDLSKLLNIDPINIGFGGKLYFTIGALGHGKHAAHFAHGQAHPDGGMVEVINITNTQGDGTVAHEWFHALDYYLGQGKMGSNRSVRALVAELKNKYDIANLNQVPTKFIEQNWAYKLGKNATKLEQAAYAINYGSYGRKVSTNYYKNAVELGAKYWGNEFELLARAAEAWAFDTLATTKNNYLVSDWVADGHASKENGYRGTPYPTNEERVHFSKVFDSFVKALSFTDGVPTIDDDAFEANMPSAEKEFNAAKQDMLAQLPAMLAAHEATKRAKQLAALNQDNAGSASAKAHLEAQRIEKARMEAIAEAELANAVKPDATVTEGALSEEELNAIFDDAENEIAEEQQEQPDVPNMGDAAIGETKENGDLTNKATSQLLADAAKLGLTGMDEALSGLAKLFGAGRIMSFPSGFDEEAYKQAKPHFEAALKASASLGLTLQELFKRLIQLFGAGVRPYAIKFAQEQGLSASLANKEVGDATTDANTTRADDINGDAESSAENVSGTESGAEPSDSDTGQGGRGGSDLRNDVESTENAVTTASDAGFNDTDTPIAASGEPSLPSSIEPSNGVSVRGRDYHAPVGSLTREGSWRDTASRNLDVIELLKKLETENRTATPQEQAILVKYTGWGASELRNNLFTSNYGSSTSRLLKPEYARPDWRDIVARAQALLTPEDIDAAMRSSQYAHYTSEKVIRSIWAGLDRMGFSGGRVLEGGMGTGLFAIAAPEGMLQKSRYTGIEMDTLTASIAKQLLPEQVVMQADFVKQKLPNGFFDVAIGNPPFANISIKDDPDYKKYGFMLHDYFFAKSIDKVRDGGILAFVTSRGTMDKQGDKARQYLAERADLLGAIRLPQTAFKDNAGTQVITDVIFLRKRAKGEAETVNPWMNLASVETNNGNTTMVNEYFAAHPEMVLGTHTTQRGQYSDEAYNVLPFEGDIEEQFAKAIQNLPAGIYTQFKPNNELVAETIERDFNPKAQKEGSVYITDGGRLMRREQGSGVPLETVMSLTDRESAWMKSYVGLRDAIKQAQFDQLNEGDWETSLKALNKTYDAFVKEHGAVNEFTVYDRTSTNDEGEVVTTEYKRYKNNKLLRADTEGTLVEALERITEDGSITKSPFLLERTIKKPERQAINGLNDALLVSLDEQGRINLDHIAELAKMPKESVIQELGDLLFESPNGEWQMSDEYLSGDVTEKLHEAEAAARIDPKFERNVKALLLAQPKPLSPAQITVMLGSNWIPAQEVTIFANEVLEVYTTVTYNQNTNVWTVDGADGHGSHRNRTASSSWGTVDRSTQEILSDVLNGNQLKITKTMEVDGRKSTYTDQAGTAAVNEVAKKMRQEFSTWVWRDTNRAEQLSALYNAKFNNIAPRVFNGNHLTLPNLSMRYKLFDHQKRAIWRIIQTGNTYLAHAVGSGKTLEMIVSAMEQKRLGLISKPMFTVPNHMLNQFAAEFLDAYPTANIMVADDVNFHTDNRRRFVSQAALNNPDAIVITHSAFGLIKTTQATNDVVVRELIEQLEYSAQEEKDKRARAKIESRIENIQRKFDSKQSDETKDQQITFEELGVDFLYVDEGHEFRKLDFVSNRGNIKGIDPNGSQKALGLFIKARWLNSQRPNRSLVLASGTPVTNTMAELYTVMRYMSPETLEKAGLDHFDAWANMFGVVASSFEMNAAGKYEVVERFSKFVNVPELMKRVRLHMDVLTNSQLSGLVKRPTIKGSMPTTVIVPASPATVAYLRDELTERIITSRAWKPSPDQKGNPDPLINIITDGRLSAIDMRFVDKSAPNDPASKLNVMIDDIIRDYNKQKNNTYVDVVTGKKDAIKGSTQIIFSAVGFGDQVAKSRGFDAKAWMAKRLKNEANITDIAFMSDFNTAAKKEGLFKDMRSGKRKQLYGSPKNMGTGVNVQKRLKNLYFLSPPWFPADIEQAQGRIERQGNQNEEIEINWYATKGTYDSTAWSMNSRKAKFIEQAFTGDDSVRSMEDVSESSQYEMVSALASGDERAIQLAGYKADIERLLQLKQAHANTQGTLRHDKASTEFNIKSNTARLDKFKAAKALLPDFIYGDGLNATIGGALLSKRSDIGDALIAAGDKAIQAYKGSDDGADVQIGLALGTHPIMLNIKTELKHNGVDLERVKVAQMFVQVGEVQMPLDLDHRRTYSESDASGLATRLNNALNGVGRKVSEIEGNIDSLANQLKQINSKIGAPFPEERELFDKIAESAQLEKDMLTDKVEIPSDEALLAMKEAKEAGTFPPSGLDSTYHFVHSGKGIAAITDGDTINIPDLPDFNFFIHPTNSGFYTITHVESGLLLAKGDNKLDVVQKALERIDSYGIDKVIDVINNAPKITEQDKQAAVKALDEPLESRASIEQEKSTPDSIRAAFVKAFGAKAITQLEANNLIEIIASADELPTGLNISKTGIAVFAGNKAYFIADRMSADTAHQALLHEIGEHYGLERMLGVEAYDTLLAKVRELKDSDAIVRAAWDFVKTNYPTLATDSKNFMHEVLAQIGQNADISARQWWKQVLEAAKRFLVKLGFTGMVKVSDIQDMVLHSLKVAAMPSNNESTSNQSSLFDESLALQSSTDRIQRAIDAGFLTKAKWKAIKDGIQSGRADNETSPSQERSGNTQSDNDDTRQLFQFYHGTRDDIQQGFTLEHPNRKDRGWLGNGIYMSDDPDVARFYTEQKYGDASPNTLPLTIKINNPFIADIAYKAKLKNASASFIKEVTDALKANGYDSVILPFGDSTNEILVFDTANIRSIFAAFNPKNADSSDLLESRGNFMSGINMDTLRADITQRANDTFNTKKTFNNWWHKTVGTQYHKAEVDPEHFGKVYNMAQLFIRDLARYANTAADKAPNLLPKMESITDAVRGLGTISRDNADAKAIAEPIFEGTLNDKVYDTDELRSRFNLTDRQITLYEEFRASVNQSLDDLAISEMGRLARTEAIPLAPEGISLDEATAYYRQHYEGDLEKAQLAVDDLKERQQQERGLLKDASSNIESEQYVNQLLDMRTRHATELAEANAAVDNFMELHKGIQEKADKINALKANGYAPLMRFGQYTVDVYMENKDGTVSKDASGEEQRQFFGMFESEAEANRMARELQAEYPTSVVKQGILSQEASSLFRGVTPETVELFARMAGDSQSDAFQKYLKMAVNNRSAMKRLIKRLGVKGFSDEPTRVLASFITSNARAAASNDYFGDMLKAASDIPKNKGDVKDEAIKLMQYIQNPQEEASKLRGLLFMNFLGGSIASAMVNMTQPILMTYPYLHQFSPSAAKHLAWAMKMASKKLVGKDVKIDDEALTAALSRAADEGVTSPHEVHMLYGESSRTSALSGNRWMRNLTKVWGGFFAVAENFNRNATFIAAFKIAEENGLNNDAAYDFAKKAVDDTQGVYNKANRPDWARGAVGATLFTFKQFSVSYIEFLKRLPAKERAIALAILVLASGAQGLPASDDLDDLIDTLMQSLGLSWNTKEEKRDFVAKIFGKEGANYVMYGISYGLPIDLAGRLSAGNLLPMTAILKKSESDKTRDVSEFFGAVGGAATNYMTGFEKLQGGNYTDAAKAIAPKALNDALKGYDMLVTGEAHDSKGRLIAKATPIDALVKAIGFNPSHIAASSRDRGVLIQDANLLKVTQSNIYERWAQGVAQKDTDKLASAKAELARWNAKNPEQKIEIKLSTIQRRVKAMQQDANERFIKSSPKQLRAENTAILNQ